MHEYPITLQIIKIAEKHCREAGGEKVKKIHLVVGDYSGYIGDSIRMYFDAIGQGTLCEDAEIQITRVKPQLKCTGCGQHFEKIPMSFSCPHCGGEGGPSSVGKEFHIETIEIE
jgi:hydrogenase nickel incorporation protein HypA/HybF